MCNCNDFISLNNLVGAVKLDGLTVDFIVIIIIFLSVNKVLIDNQNRQEPKYMGHIPSSPMHADLVIQETQILSTNVVKY